MSDFDKTEPVEDKDTDDSKSSSKRKETSKVQSAQNAQRSSGKSNGRTKQDKKASEKEDSWFNRISGITSSAFRMARRTTDGGIKVGKTILKSQDQLKVMVAAGQSLKDLREVAGLTIHELSEAINLKDKSLLEAVENGTATLSFELILRLAALLARNDPVPFILRYTRTYNPEVWKILNDWGLGRLPLQYERERKFINIYRRHDAARKLSDDGYEKVLAFTQNAFEMALHFIAEAENVEFDEEKENGNKEKSAKRKSEHIDENEEEAEESKDSKKDRSTRDED